MEPGANGGVVLPKLVVLAFQFLYSFDERRGQDGNPLIFRASPQLMYSNRNFLRTCARWSKRWDGDGAVRNSPIFTLILAVFASLFAWSEFRAETSRTTEAPWVVQLLIGSNAWCTGSVLAERWILTAARCLEGFPKQANVTVYYADGEGTRSEVYDGLSVLRQHMYYQHHNFPSWLIDLPDVDHDVGLIELIRGSIDLSVTGRAKLYAPSRPKPWSTGGANRDFVMIGWGNTNAPSCAALESKRIGTGFTFDGANHDAESLRARIDDLHSCLGDPGTPWLLKIGGEYLEIAVHHGTKNFEFTVGLRYVASLITTKTGWIWDVSRNLRYEPKTGNYTVYGLSCGGGVGDPGYIECFERDGGTVVPPPPQPPCPRGRHCCEAIGDECRRCIPDGAVCE